MSFDLDIDAARWRAHIDSVAGGAASIADCHLVPVIKGQGYGLGAQLLLGEATRIGASTVALGTINEVSDLSDAYAGQQLVLAPYDPRDLSAAQEWHRHHAATSAGRLLRTIASPEALRALAESSLADPRAGGGIVVEGLTSMRRFGMTPRVMAEVLTDESVRTALATGALTLHGLALHLPLTSPTPSRVDQVLAWSREWSDLTGTVGARSGSAASVETARTLWISHLSDADLATVRAATSMVLRPRVGTRLWHGDRGALRASGTVLAVHPLDHREPVGYRQRSGDRGATLVVVAGGTSHGVALSAPIAGTSTRQRIGAARTGLLEAVGRSRSPFRWAGRRLWFAEPPHMHVSLAWIPRGGVIPAVGDRLPAEVRFTTSTFDEVRLS